MTAVITHTFNSLITDTGTPPGAVGPDEWNANHTITGIVGIAQGGTDVGTGSPSTAGRIFSVGVGATLPAFNTNVVLTGYFNLGVATAPANTTGGDHTALRGHFGTDTAFITSGTGGVVVVPGVQVNAKSLAVIGTITNNSANTVAIVCQTTFNGSASAPIGMLLIPTYSPSATIAAAVGGSYAVQGAPPVSVTITTLRALQIRTDYSATSGAITNGEGLLVAAPIVSGSLKPTNQTGISILNQGISGTTTSRALDIAAQSGSTNNTAIRTQGGDHRFVGAVEIGADVAVTSGYILEAQGGRVGVIPTYTTTTQLDASLFVGGTITNNTTAIIGGVHFGMSFNGSGDSPIALIIRPFFAPSSPITDAMGASLAGIHNGGTITNLVGFRPVVASFSNTGAVTNFMGVRCDGPAFTGSVRPTNIFGIDIQNQGVASVTKAVGLRIQAQSGATNNYLMELGGTDTTALGAYRGRIPVLWNGAIGYMPIYA